MNQDCSSAPIARDVTPIDRPGNELEVMHIDAIVLECGMFDSQSKLNNGYGCLASQNTESPGCCHTFACPIAVELDEEDPEWDESYSPGEWMKKHSEFKDA